MFDYIVVTAASARQAAAYEAELRDRALRGDLPAATRAMAVADPGGKRHARRESRLYCGYVMC